jgi:hypothetical protein
LEWVQADGVEVLMYTVVDLAPDGSPGAVLGSFRDLADAFIFSDRS